MTDRLLLLSLAMFAVPAMAWAQKVEYPDEAEHKTGRAAQTIVLKFGPERTPLTLLYPGPGLGPMGLKATSHHPGNFDRWIFGGDRAVGEPDRYLEARLAARLARVDSRITEAQKAKLRLAGMGDIKHLLERIDAKRAEFEEERHSFEAGLAVLVGADSLTRDYRDGPFGDGSLFSKTLRHIEVSAAPPADRGGRRD